MAYFGAHDALVKALASQDAPAAVAAIVADIEGGTALFLDCVRGSERAGFALSLVTGPSPRRKQRQRQRVPA